MFKYKTEEELEKMTPEQRDIYSEQKRDHELKATEKMISDAIAKALPNKEKEVTDAVKAKNPGKTDTEIKVLVDEAMKAEIEALPNLKKEIKELREDVAVIKENSGGSTKVVSLEKAIETEMTAIKAAGSNRKVHEFVVKADTLRASVVGNQAALDLTNIGQLATRKLTMYDIFPKVPVGTDQNGVVRYVDWDEATKVRSAAAVAEGAAFPESTAKWATYTLELKKVGDTVPVSEEMLYDAPRFAAELKSFLETNVNVVIDTALVTGAGTGATILGIKAQIPNYTAAAAGITDANIYDLIVKVRETITSSYGSKYSPNVALMNIADINKMKLKKDANNNYIMPPFVTRDGNLVDGILVMECNAFAANTMAVGDTRYGKIYEEPGMYVATGYDGSDWTNDMQTLKARKRLNLLIRTVDQTGWLEVTSISAALTTLAT